MKKTYSKIAELIRYTDQKCIEADDAENNIIYDMWDEVNCKLREINQIIKKNLWIITLRPAGSR